MGLPRPVRLHLWPAHSTRPRNTQPGGWLELQTFDPVIHCADASPPKYSAIMTWTNLLVHAGNKLGRALFPAQELQGWVTAGGYENVGNQTFDVFFGTWAKDRALKELGIMFAVQMIQGLEARACALCAMCSGGSWTTSGSFWER